LAQGRSRDGQRADGAGISYECDALIVAPAPPACRPQSTAAARCGLNVLIVEKEPRFGGTTARSGGWLWIPGTSLARAWGIHESPDQARTYLRHEAGNSFDEARVDAFLIAGPQAVDFFTSATSLCLTCRWCFRLSRGSSRRNARAAARW